jgi:hypothetical protein
MNVLKSITKNEASVINKDYVKYTDKFDFDLWEKFQCTNLKKNEIVLVKDNDEFKIVKVTLVSVDMAGEPKVRVTDGKFSWRIEHCCKLPSKVKA